MLKRLRIKFVCINMLIATAMLMVILGLVLRFTSQSLENASIRAMQSVAAEPGFSERPGGPLQGARLPFFMVQIGLHGELAAVGNGYFDLSDEALVRKLTEAALATGAQTDVLKDYGLRFCLVAGPGGQRIVFADMSGEQATLRSLLRSCVAVGIAAFLVFLLISLWLARWAVKPVDEAWTQQRQFVADASHELKTPLTVILTNAELLADPACGERERARFARSILTMARQMRGLVEALLELARVDADAVKADDAPLDLSQLVSNALLPFEPLYFERGLELNSELEAGIQLKGSQTHLRQVVDILLDNAMKYSGPSSTVAVGLKRRDARCLLWVSNQGEPIAPSDLTDIFKRFYRVDKARRMDHSYGLGLPIAEGIVKAHRGRIWAQSADGKNTFFVELPVLR